METVDWVGRRLEKYQILALIGHGGMGTVCRALDTVLNRHVALKFLQAEPADPLSNKRFLYEAQAIAQLRHPNIVQIYDFATCEQGYYMVLTLIEGEDLHHRLARFHSRGERLPLSSIKKITNQTMDALAYIHSQHFVHRDIKPSNILLDSDDNAFLADFGIARWLNKEYETTMGVPIGTPMYVAPEQARGLPTVDHRADLYSLAVVLYEMLAARPPFLSENAVELIHKHMYEPAPNIRQFAPDVPIGVEMVLSRALRKSPKYRYPDVRVFQRELQIAWESADLPIEGTITPNFIEVDAKTINFEESLAPKPTLQSVVPVPFQAPSDKNYSVNREQEIEKICAALKRPRGQQIFCLTGMGGTGKTTLAIHVAHLLRSEFSDGVLWADLAASSSLAIIDSWAYAYGYDFSRLVDLEARATALRGILASKRVLIILDNVQDIAQVNPLIPGGSSCVVLMTTRNQSLVTALSGTLMEIPVLTPTESFQLLLNIAGAERVITEADVADRISELLGYLPLAIEIVAKYLKSHYHRKLSHLVEMLHDAQFRAKLNSELEASFEIGWKVLGNNLRQIFAQVAVFEGRPFTAESFAAISEMTPWIAEDELDALVAFSLLSEVKDRYQQHPALVDFAHSHLQDSPRLHRRMVQYFLDYARNHYGDYAALELEWDNINAGIQVAYQEKMWDTLIAYAAALTDVWFTRGYYTEARQVYAWISAVRETAITQQDLAKSLCDWGRACIAQTDYPEAEQVLSHCLQVCESIGDQPGKARALCYLAQSALEQADYERALSLLGESRRIRESLTDQSGVAETLYMEARIYYLQGEYERAHTLGVEVMQTQQANNDIRGAMNTLSLLAKTVFVQEDMNTAETYGRRALDLCKQLHEKHEQAIILETLSHIYRRRGLFRDALTHAQLSLQLVEEVGDLHATAGLLYQLSIIHECETNYELALDYGLKSLTLSQDLNYSLLTAYILIHLGDVYTKLGENRRAVEKWQEALRIAQSLKHPTAIQNSEQRLSQK